MSVKVDSLGVIWLAGQSTTHLCYIQATSAWFMFRQVIQKFFRESARGRSWRELGMLDQMGQRLVSFVTDRLEACSPA
jgi:hypothetical protein